MTRKASGPARERDPAPGGVESARGLGVGSHFVRHGGLILVGPRAAAAVRWFAMDCPRCGAPAVTTPACPRCGVIVSKARPTAAREERIERWRAAAAATRPRHGGDPAEGAPEEVAAPADGGMRWPRSSRSSSRSRSAGRRPARRTRRRVARALGAVATADAADAPPPPAAAVELLAAAHRGRDQGGGEGPLRSRPPADRGAGASCRSRRRDDRVRRLGRGGPARRAPRGEGAAQPAAGRPARRGRATSGARNFTGRGRRTCGAPPQSTRRARGPWPRWWIPSIEAGDWTGAEAAARRRWPSTAGRPSSGSSSATRSCGWTATGRRRRCFAPPSRSRTTRRPARCWPGWRKGCSDEKGMTEQRLSHFHVRYDGDAHEDVGREILRALERHYATLAREPRPPAAQPDPGHPVLARGYFDASGAPAWSGGVFDGIGRAHPHPHRRADRRA